VPGICYFFNSLKESQKTNILQFDNGRNLQNKEGSTSRERIRYSTEHGNRDMT